MPTQWNRVTRVSLIILITHTYFIGQCEAHGRMLEPPARNTLWRFGFKSPPNYNDNELFCGGIGGITRNEGKCGICGDPYDGLRLHETGQMMAPNETTRNYFPGSSIDLMIEIVANHGGTFKFEMCWRDQWSVKESEDCFEELRFSGHSSGASTEVPAATNKVADEDQEEEESAFEYELDPARGTGMYTMSVELPVNRTCENCVLRWHWRSANNWGRCEDGSERVGCGLQEVYRNCADVSVKRNGAGVGLGLSRRRR